MAGFVIPELRRAKPARTAPAPAPARSCRPRPPARPPHRPAAAADTRPHNVASRRRLCTREDAEDTDTERPRRRWRFAAHTGAGRSWRSSTIAATPAAASVDRPGLVYAVNTIRSRAATGLVVAHIRDFTDRVADLATLLKPGSPTRTPSWAPPTTSSTRPPARAEAPRGRSSRSLAGNASGCRRARATTS